MIYETPEDLDDRLIELQNENVQLLRQYEIARKTLSIIGNLLFDKGYEPAFVAGILGNIYHEGKIGYFESSAYTSNPSLEPEYLKYMDNEWSYRTKYSGKCIFNVSMREVGKMLEKLKSYEWKRVKFV